MNSLDFSRVLVPLLSVCGEIQTRVQLWIAELLYKPLRVLLHCGRIHVLKHLPVRRNHGETSVSESRETHHHAQLSVNITAGLQELAHVSRHLWSELEAIGQLKTNTHNKPSIHRDELQVTERTCVQ